MEKSIDIWGCCVSRDIFGIGSKDQYDYSVKHYFQECSKSIAFQQHRLPDTEDLVERFEKESGCYHAFAKWFHADYTKSVPRTLQSEKGEWLIVDFLTETYELAKVRMGDIEECVTFSGGIFRKDFFEKNSIPYNVLYAHMVDISSWMDDFVRFCKEVYGDHVILVEVGLAEKILTHSNKVRDWITPLPMNDRQKELLYKLNLEFIKRTDYPVVKVPLELLGYERHKWGISRVHFVDEYYDYARRCIDCIVQGRQNELDRLYLECNHALSLKSRGLSLNYLENAEKLNAVCNSGKTDSIRKIVYELMDQQDFNVVEVLRENLGAGKITLDLFVDAVRYAIGHQCDSLSYETLCVFSQNLSLIFPEFIDYLEKASCNDRYAMLTLGRFYLWGAHVVQDREKAISLFRGATNLNLRAARDELFDLLWSFGDSKSDSEMLELVREPAEYFDTGAMLRLARLYCAGKGVLQDYTKGMEWLRKTSTCGVIQAKYELFDILWNLDNPEIVSERFNLMWGPANCGDSEAMLRLGRHFLDGKGSEINLDEAVRWFRRSAELGNVQAAGYLSELE